MMLQVARRTLVAAGVMLAIAIPAVAQTDYRNLEAGRPLRVEDAYALERHAFEFALPVRSASGGGVSSAAIAPVLEYGVFRNAQISLALPFEQEDAGRSVWGTSGLSGGALANFFTESPHLPALSLHAGGTVPFGAFAGPAHGDVQALLTRSFGASRLHLNAAHRIGPDATEGAVTPRWWYGAALDHTQYRSSFLLLLEARAERAANSEPISAVIGGGVRWQWTPTFVLSLGAARRLTDTGPDREITIGITHVFAVPWLMPVRGRPMPERPTDASGGHRHD